ncbi:MAG TPA: hypothetical protein VJ874_05670 [Candidatus Thermoplasmatota archaeon]|nr:hypothetical protein [Candidatus Thermoplasmatota archaeon]
MQEALQLFKKGRFPSMGHAALAAADAEALAGDEEIGEVADLFGMLERRGDVDSLMELERPARRAKG